MCALGIVLPITLNHSTGASPKDIANVVHGDVRDGYLHAVDARERRRIGEDHELDEGDVVKIDSTAS